MEKTIKQPAILRFYHSPIGKKLTTGITGLGLSLFVLAHMVGNLLMFVGHDAYNTYAYLLERVWPLLWTVELVLLAVFLLHAATGLYIFRTRLQARPVAYATYASRGEPSLQSLSSRTMIITGGALGTFLVIHLMHFKYGTYYTTELGGQEVRDLARLVVENFRRPVYTWSYSGVVVLLGFHLRHGVWSALQSLGTMAKSFKPLLYGVSLVFAIAIATGFLILPLAIYFNLVN
ncbi:MAG: succinate dehydrogenase cytochrome b subunit [Leptolyngbya sp. SIO1E4]|nr:succinate dehydrogenase cytochrome b subunit [Leptolyngbya sp. SIO1E4]